MNSLAGRFCGAFYVRGRCIGSGQGSQYLGVFGGGGILLKHGLRITRLRATWRWGGSASGGATPPLREYRVEGAAFPGARCGSLSARARIKRSPCVDLNAPRVRINNSDQTVGGGSAGNLTSGSAIKADTCLRGATRARDSPRFFRQDDLCFGQKIWLVRGIVH